VTQEIALILAILGVAILLFVTERIRVDLIALLVMVSLAFTGLVTPEEALSGFSNLAVVTVWAILILSGGLSRTGVANLIGRQISRLAGHSEVRLLVIIMITAGVLSGFMNNIGVAALMMPVVINLARRMNRPPSKFLIPLAFASLLGGLSTLIGTPPNILISESMRDFGLEPFGMFDYAPVGAAVLIAGVFFIVLIGRHLLPSRDIAKESSRAPEEDLGDVYDFSDRLFRVKLLDDSPLDGKTLAESHLGSALGLNVIAIQREDETRLAPTPQMKLISGDALLVGGRLDLLDEIRGKRHILMEDDHVTAERLISPEVGVAEVQIAPGSTLLGQTLIDSDLRKNSGLNVLAIHRKGQAHLNHIHDYVLKEGDTLLMQGRKADLEAFAQSPDIESFREISTGEVAKEYRLQDSLISLRIPKDSILVGRTLAQSRLGDAFGLDVLGLNREGETELLPDPKEPLLADDVLLVHGDPEDLRTLRGLQRLEIDPRAELDLNDFESEHVGLAEVVLSPHSTLVGKNLRQLHFREKYGLSVLAIWRGGEAYRSRLRDMALRFGDALLLYGRRERLRVLGSEPDFLVLTEEAQEPPRLEKAPLALLILAGVLVPVLLNWLPIAIAAVAGSVLMILTGCLTMEEAYRSIDWRAIFLIAGMLPMGIAMEQTGAAHLISEGVVRITGGFGPLAVLAGLFVLAALAAQVMPNPAVAVLLAPIAFNSAVDLGVSPYPMMMAVAISASAAFLSPVGHPANVLIMGPGGYRLGDYLKIGIPLTLLVLVVVLLVLPVVWSF
jgi:di/tricarboxylate transporter